MMTTFMEDYVVYGLYWVLIAAWRAIPVVTVVLLLDWLLGRRLAARFQCLLWALVIVRLAVAVTIPAPFSVHGPLDRFAVSLMEPTPDPVVDDTIQFVSDNGETFSVVSDQAAQPISGSTADLYTATTPAAVVVTSAWPWEEILAYAILGGWAMVFAALCLRGAIQYLRFHLALRRCDNVEQQDVVDELLRVCDRLGCRRRPQMKATDQVDVPAVFGVWRPTICLPVGLLPELSPTDLRLILQHEVSHIVRRDALVLSVAGIVRAAQWFNPFAWLAYYRLRNSIERAADERALRGAERTTLREYGELLLRFGTASSTGKQPATVGLLFMSARRRLTERISGLEQLEQSHSWTARILGLGLATALAMTGLFDGTAADETPAPPASQPWVHVPLPSADGQPLAEYPPRKLVERTFDVSAALQKLQDTMDASPEQIERHLASHFLHAGELPAIADGQITLRDTEAAHRNTQSMLNAIAQSGTVQIVIDCRTIYASLNVADDFDWILPDGSDCPGQSIGTIHEPPLVQLPELSELLSSAGQGVPLKTVERNLHLRPSIRMKVSAFQKRLLLRRCDQGPRNNVLHAPRVTLFNGQQAVVTDATQRPFVVGLEERKAGRQSALQPVIRVFDDGWKIHLSPVAGDDGSVDLRCVITESEILDVEVVDLPARGGERSAVQVPTVRERSIQSMARLADGESLLIASPEPRSTGQPAEETMARFYLLTPTIIADPGFTPGKDGLPADPRATGQQSPEQPSVD